MTFLQAALNRDEVHEAKVKHRVSFLYEADVNSSFNSQRLVFSVASGSQYFVKTL